MKFILPQIAILIVALLLAVFLTYTFTHKSTSSEVRALESQIKVEALDIKRSQDSLKLLSKYVTNLIEKNSLLLDSISIINSKRNEIKTVIRYIHAEPLSANDLTRRFTKRYNNLLPSN